MVTASCRIGYDFSTPDGPLTMKLAETPSRSAGLIISVFGVASSPSASLPARKTRRLGGAPSVRGRAGSVKERPREGGSREARRGPGDRPRGPRWRCSDPELPLRRFLLRSRLRAWLALRAGLRIGLPLRGRSGVLARRQLRRRSLEERLTVGLRVLVVERDQGHLPLIDAWQVLALRVCVALAVRLDLSDQDGIARGRDEPELVDLGRRRGREAVRIETHPGLPVRLLAPGRGALGGARDHEVVFRDSKWSSGTRRCGRRARCRWWRSPCPPGWASTVHETTQVAARRPAGGGARVPR